MDTKTVSNAERKRLARARALIELQRSQKSEQGSITAFRAEEMYWKNRITEPDWNLAFQAHSDDIEWTTSLSPDVEAGVRIASWKDRSGKAWEVQEWKLENGKTACCFIDNPGLIVLPGFLDIAEQQELILGALQETTGPASRTNLDSHYYPPSSGWWERYVQAPHEHIQTRAAGQAVLTEFRPSTQRVQVDLKPMSTSDFQKDQATVKEEPIPSATVQPLSTATLMRKLRWTIIGLEYHWGTKSYIWDKPPMPMPRIFQRTCQQIASTIPWSSIPLTKRGILDTSGWQNYKPEAGVVNFYQYRDSLTAHVDQSEVDSVRPLISISLGESCIFLAGGTTRDQTPISFLLNSGDIIIMAGDARRVFHGVPRIIEESCRTRFHWSQYQNGDKVQTFLKGTRLNINVRQVFPEDAHNLQNGQDQDR